MKHPRNLFLFPAAFAVVIALSAPASAQETATVRTGGHGLGVGYAAMLTGPAGLSLAYDFGRFHVDSLIDISSNGGTDLAIAGRGWLHLHSTGAADFSVGGGLGLTKSSPGDDDLSVVHIELGVLIRAFLVSNVAVSAFGGLGIRSGDVGGADDWELDAQPLGGIGLTYYFH
jgi:hypothetical protein